MGEELLTKEEKEYLRMVIKPFKENVYGIEMDSCLNDEIRCLIIWVSYDTLEQEEELTGVFIPLITNELKFANLSYTRTYKLEELEI